jgi:hypothetical protein
VAISWSEEELNDFEEMKTKLRKTPPLTTAQPYDPFILRCDASDRAIGAVLEQIHPDLKNDTPIRERVLTEKCTRPVAFLSRKLAPGPAKTWSVREKETYAIVCAILKWATWIGIQPVLILTDHKSLESWATELLDTPSGPAGRRARWHELFSRFNLEVVYVPGAQNVVADAMSRWAYPANSALVDISVHGSAKDTREALDIVAQEIREENESEDHHHASTTAGMRATGLSDSEDDDFGMHDGQAAQIAPVTTRAARRMQSSVMSPDKVLPRVSRIKRMGYKSLTTRMHPRCFLLSPHPCPPT